MKNLLVLFSVFMLSLVAFPQSSVNLTVKLNPIQSITVNNQQSDVILDYVTKSDYESGVSVLLQDHLTVFSTGGFEIKAKSSNPSLISSGREIALSDITITPFDGSTKPLNNSQYSPVMLSQSNQTLVSSSKGSVDRNFNVSYAAKGDYEYIDMYVSGQPNEFKTIVQYSIVPR